MRNPAAFDGGHNVLDLAADCGLVRVEVLLFAELPGVEVAPGRAVLLLDLGFRPFDRLAGVLVDLGLFEPVAIGQVYPFAAVAVTHRAALKGKPCIKFGLAIAFDLGAVVVGRLRGGEVLRHAPGRAFLTPDKIDRLAARRKGSLLGRLSGPS